MNGEFHPANSDAHHPVAGMKLLDMIIAALKRAVFSQFDLGNTGRIPQD